MIVTTTDTMTGMLMELVEREHQRINTLEQQVKHLNQELAQERHIRRMLSTRVDHMEMAR